jgi:hypothetical protein
MRRCLAQELLEFLATVDLDIRRGLAMPDEILRDDVVEEIQLPRVHRVFQSPDQRLDFLGRSTHLLPNLLEERNQSR